MSTRRTIDVLHTSTTKTIYNIFDDIQYIRREEQYRAAVRKLWPAGQIWPLARFQLARVTLLAK